MKSKTENSRKIRNLIRIGVFSALWIVVSWIVGCTIGFYPPIIVILPCVMAIIGSTIYVVMLSKIDINGGILISSFLFGICLFSMAPYGMMFICTFAGGIIGELIYDTLGKTSTAGKITGITMPILGLALGEYIPIVYLPDVFRTFYEDKNSAQVAQASVGLINTNLMIGLIIATIICSCIGYFWGRSISARQLNNR